MHILLHNTTTMLQWMYMYSITSYITCILSDKFLDGL